MRIYYGDGSVYEGPPEDAPTQNVQAIAWNDPERGAADLGRVVLSQWDLYIYSDIGWHGTNKYADLVRHVQRGTVKAVLEGQWIDRNTWLEIEKRARTDSGLRPKSANDPVREDGSE